MVTVAPDRMTRVVFLGAGKGSRLLPYTADLPKWLLPIRGRSLIQYLTATAHHAGMTDVTLVRGLAGGNPGLPCIGILENHKQFNMVDSLFTAEARFGDDFIMSYADLLYEPRVFEAMLGSNADVAIAVDTDWVDYYRFRSGDPYAMAESLRLDGEHVVEIGNALRRSEPLPLAQYFGLVRFQGAGVSRLSGTYHELLSRYQGMPWRHARRFEDAFMTDLLQELIDRGVDVRAVPVKRGWLEFDSKDDYERVIAANTSGELTRYMQLDVLPKRPTVLSAGGILWRVDDGALEIMAVMQGTQGEWRLPKGMQEPGEPIKLTASREVGEETGICCHTGEYVGTSSWTYEYGGREWDEIARFYLMEPLGGSSPISDSQILAAEWTPLPLAAERMKYSDERQLVRLAGDLLVSRL
jgi:choline kinase/8-oxo-dGTP pyrophosphatase MutT (NUDIX family)